MPNYLHMEETMSTNELKFLNNSDKKLLSLFFKRLCFYHVLECTDGGNDKEQAYQILDAVRKIREELSL